MEFKKKFFLLQNKIFEILRILKGGSSLYLKLSSVEAKLVHVISAVRRVVVVHVHVMDWLCHLIKYFDGVENIFR